MSVNVNYNYDKYKGEWQPLTHYAQYDLVHFNDALWIADATFVTGAVFDAMNWTCHSCADDPYPYPVGTELGFDVSDLGGSSALGHTHVGGDPAVVENSTSGDLTKSYVKAFADPNNVSPTINQLRYYEMEILSGGPYCGFGTNSTAGWLGSKTNSVGFKSSVGEVWRSDSLMIIGNPVPVGGYVRFWSRLGRLWIGSYSDLYGYEIIGGGDPYLNFNPTSTVAGFIVPGESNPLATCYSPGDMVRLNTVGNFAHPPLPSARPWDS